MQRYFFEIAYNGKNYHGWQIQNNAPSVQGEVESRMKKYFGQEDLSVVGCGRTDTGVHTKQFYFHVDLDREATEEDVFRMNRFLPDDIVMYRHLSVDGQAHARFDATSRTYQYLLTSQKDPFLTGSAWYLSGDIDREKMNKAAEVLLHYQDFASFCKVGSDNKTTLCDITRAEWKERDGLLVFTISADRFLRNMVRAVVGTLVEVGLGKLTIDGFREIIEIGDRSEAGMSAPAHGLYLTEVNYPYIEE